MEDETEVWTVRQVLSKASEDPELLQALLGAVIGALAVDMVTENDLPMWPVTHGLTSFSPIDVIGAYTAFVSGAEECPEYDGEPDVLAMVIGPIALSSLTLFESSLQRPPGVTTH